MSLYGQKSDTVSVIEIDTYLVPKSHSDGSSM